MCTRGTLLLAVYGDEKRYNIICVPSTYILYRYTQFNVILLSVSIENFPSVAHTHIYAHILASDCEMVHISVNGRSYIYNEKTLLSSATYVFIKNSANGSETAISICNAVNNSTTLPSPTRQAALTDHPSTTLTQRGKTKFVFRIIAITFLGPFRSGTWDRCSFFRSHSIRCCSSSLTSRPRGGGEQWLRTDGVFGVYYTILPSVGVFASIYVYVYVCVCECEHT